MSEVIQDFSDEPEDVQRESRLGNKSKMPKTPDFSERMVQPRRSTPFILDDFRGSLAYKSFKP